jgi:hypothetical protein
MIFSESGYGNGRRRTPSMTLKMAVELAMPRARVMSAAKVKPGFYNSIRMP